MPKCPTHYSKLLTSSLYQRLKNHTLFPIDLKFSSLSIPSGNEEPDPPISEEIFRKGPNFGAYKSGDSTFYSLIENYASLGDFGSLEKVLDRMKRERRVFVEGSFIAVFRAFGKAHLPNQAVDLFHRMVDEFQCRRTVKSFNSVLNVIVQEGHYAHALEFYDHVVGDRSMNISPNVLSYNLIIKALCRFGLVDKAVEKFREMPVRDCAPDVFTYCTLMDGLCKVNRVDEAVFLLDEMQIEGCSPSPAAFNVLIDAVCKKGDLGRAAKLVDNMFLKGCVPNEVTYNTLIHGLCLQGKLEKAISLLDRMVLNKCVPNDVTYGTIINGLVKQGRSLDGVRVLISMEERGRRANEYIYSVLVSGLFKEGKSEEAMKLWKEMMEKGCKPNTVVYSALIDGLCLDGKPDEAKEVFCEMVRNGCMPNSYAYSSLMRGFFRTGQSQKAILLWKEMAANNVVRNEVCYSVIIDGFCKEGKVKEALMVWKQILARGYKLDVVAYSSMIHGLCNDGLVEQGLKLFNDMLSQEPECQPDVITYNILLNALCKQHTISRAIDLLNSMLDRGCDPDLVTCDIFLTTLGEKLDPPQDGREFLNELVVRLFKRQRTVGAFRIVEVMLKKFLPPTACTWTTVVQELCKPKKMPCSWHLCEYLCVELLLYEMCKRSKVPPNQSPKQHTSGVISRFCLLSGVAIDNFQGFWRFWHTFLMGHIIGCMKAKESIVYKHHSSTYPKSYKSRRTQRSHKKNICGD